LNTRIDRPHRLDRVTSVAFSPGFKDRLTLQLVTTGDDGTVKVWRIRTVTEKNGGVEGKLF
jgi:NET1-associated nuclear protein 1 (U3 small nucleolar RNA-associated protein 17)